MHPRSFAVMALLLSAAPALAQTEVAWRNVSIRFVLESDGALKLTEWGVIEAQPLATEVERTYFTDDAQSVSFDRVVIDDAEIDADRTTPGTVRWKTSGGTYRYTIESTVTGAVTPGWDIPRDRRLDFHRDAVRVDYHYFIPPRVTQLELWQMGWPDDWKPVYPITGGNIGAETPEGYRIRHLFQSPLPWRAFEASAIRMGSIAAYPLLAFLFWLIYALREYRRRSRADMTLDDTHLRTKILTEAPEVIAAQWSGEAPYPSIEPFLRRLERQRKVGLTIQNDEEADDTRVTVRLLVSRDKLTPYERAGIDVLIPDGIDTSTDDIRRRYANQDFDPSDALHEALRKVAEESTGPQNDAWYSKLFSFVVFWSGVVLFVGDITRLTRDPTLIIAAILVPLFLGVAWPGTLVRRRLRTSKHAILLPLIGLLLTTIALVLLHLVPRTPIPPFASIGLTLLMLASYKTILSHSTGRETPESLRRQRELGLAREWARTAPGVPEEILEAFALRKPAQRPSEEWGWALSTFAEE